MMFFSTAYGYGKGGQRVRVNVCVQTWKGSNVLVLDLLSTWLGGSLIVIVNPDAMCDELNFEPRSTKSYY